MEMNQSKIILRGKVNLLPSPLSFALRTIKTYFANGISAIVYITNDNAPKISSFDTIGTLLKTSIKTYRGLVPMSPYTTPRVLNANAIVGQRERS